MTDSNRNTAGFFSRQAEAYAANPSHARGADLEIAAGFAAPGPGDRCLDIACGPGHTALRMARAAGLVIAARAMRPACSKRPGACAPNG